MWQGSTIDRVYTDINIANNTKINNIMVSFSDHYTAISIYSLPSKTKTGRDSCYCNNSLLCKPELYSTTKTSLVLFKTKTITLHLVTGGNRPNLLLKRMLRYFLKIYLMKKILQFKYRICFFY